MRSRPLIGVVASAVVGGAVFLIGEPLVESRGWAIGQSKTVELGADWPSQQLAVARENIERGRYDAARDALWRLRRVAPDYARDDVDDELRRCQALIEAPEHLAGAKSALVAGEYEKARHELERVPPGHPQRAEVEALFAARIKELDDEALTLQPERADVKKMQRLANIAELMLVLEPSSNSAVGYQLTAAKAQVDLAEPALAATHLFEEGKVDEALIAARACAKTEPRCKALVAPLSKLAPAMASLDTLGTPKLGELYRLATKVTSWSACKPVARIRDLLVDRLAARLVKCDEAGDLLCIDQELATAAEFQLVAANSDYRDRVNDYARGMAVKINQTRGSNPSLAQALTRQVLKLKSVDAKRYLVSQPESDAP